MGSDFEYDVFLSYSSKDKEKVHVLAQRLKQDGLRIWLDAWAIRPGDSIPLGDPAGSGAVPRPAHVHVPGLFRLGLEKRGASHIALPGPYQCPAAVHTAAHKAQCQLPDVASAQFARIDFQQSFKEAYVSLLIACRGVQKE